MSILKIRKIFLFSLSFIFLTAFYYPGFPSIRNLETKLLAKENAPTPTPGSGTGIVTVDFNTDEGPVTYRASGFIGITWIPNETPQDATYLSTKPQLATWMFDYLRVHTAEQNDIEYQFKLHKYNEPNTIYIPSNINGNWSLWENYVRSQVQEAYNNNYQTVEFDIWNEPDCCGYWPYGSIGEANDDPRYYEMWNRTYRIIKSVNPNFKVVGPSVLGKLSWIKNKFLPRVRADGTMPDILSWHQIGNTNVSANVTDMRAFLSANGYGNLPISINEYGNEGNSRKPGVAVQYMYEIEKARVDSASRACWQEGGDWNCPIHMGNTLLYDFANNRYPNDYKRSVYWAYKAYAEMTGKLVSVGVSPATLGVAAEDNNLRKGYVLLGNIANAGTISVNLKNLHNAPFYTAGSPIEVIVSRIPNTEANALPAPIVIQHQNITPNGTELTLTIPNTSIYDAYTITLTPADGSVPTPTPTRTPTLAVTPTRTSTPTATATPSPTGTISQTQTPNASDLIFADGFESGNLSAWTSSNIDAGDLSASAAAALIGSQGMQAVIDDAKTVYVTSDQPNAETRYRMRFYFDPNSIPMLNNDAHFIFKGFAGTSTEVLRMEFRRFSGAYQIRTSILNDGTTWLSTNWFTITDTSHSIELDWRAATAVGANNGSLTLWIDGVQRQDLTGVDNDTRRMDRARLGALTGIDAGTRGTYYFDAFESRRQTYVGP